jgi:hypothetical protein
MEEKDLKSAAYLSLDMTHFMGPSIPGSSTVGSTLDCLGLDETQSIPDGVGDATRLIQFRGGGRISSLY